MIQTILLIVGLAALSYASAVTFGEIRRRSRTSITVRIGDREIVFTHGMTPDDFARKIANEFHQRPKNGRRSKVV